MSSPQPLNLMLPGNPRYQPKELVPYFGYDRTYAGLAEVEIAVMRTMAEIGVIPAEAIALLTPEAEEALRNIPATHVDEIEYGRGDYKKRGTKHDVRAWVRAAQEVLDPRIGRWVHIPLTSYDALDTGRIVQFTAAHQHVVLPAVKQVISIFSMLAHMNAYTLQIGRTHGQHALPITVGFWLATILNRILYNIQEMNRYADGLVGKISGAVGAYNAQVGLGIEARCEPRTFEEMVLEKLGLQPARISTQILPPEPLAYYLYSAAMESAAIAQFANDCRQLMRSEIAEVGEEFEPGQVGSSAMPHKRNPLTWEGLVGQWLRTKHEFGKVLETMISEHQRDLTGSSVMRDFPIIIVNLQTQLNTLLKPNNSGVPFLARLAVSQERLEENLRRSCGLILSEPMQIALMMAGYNDDAHELVNRQLVPRVTRTDDPGALFEELLKARHEDDALNEALDRMPTEIALLLQHPSEYTGHAAKKTLEIVEQAQSFVACDD